MSAGLFVAAAAGSARPAFAQGNPDDARIRFQSLALLPAVQLTNAGWDDNVLYVYKTDGPTRDLTATVSPSVQAWLGLPHVRLSGRSDVDFIYFRKLKQIRSIDTDSSARVEVPLGRFVPYAGGTRTNARHRRNYEIDAPIRRLEEAWEAGLDARLTGKTQIGVIARRSRVDYTGDTVYLDSDLAQYLGATSKVEGVRMRYAVTPFTTVGADVERDRNRFGAAPDRNSEGVRVMTVVELQPLALVSGRARVGIRRRTFDAGQLPPFKGLVARADLGYTLMGRTRFDLAVQRDLANSYRADYREYLQTGVDLSVTHRIASAWDVGARVGRFGLSYGLDRARGSGTVAAASPVERVVSYSGEVGYSVGRTRTGVQLSRQERTSDFSVGRFYERTRIASFLTYTF